jgi:hypothetical protein
VTGPSFAPVVALPLCPACRHLRAAHWSDEGCQAPTGPDRVCGCGGVPPGDPDHPGGGPAGNGRPDGADRADDRNGEE